MTPDPLLPFLNTFLIPPDSCVILCSQLPPLLKCAPSLLFQLHWCSPLTHSLVLSNLLTSDLY